VATYNMLNKMRLKFSKIYFGLIETNYYIRIADDISAVKEVAEWV